MIYRKRANINLSKIYRSNRSYSDKRADKSNVIVLYGRFQFARNVSKNNIAIESSSTFIYFLNLDVFIFHFLYDIVDVNETIFADKPV